MDQLINQVLHDRYLIQSLLGRKTGRRTFLASDLQTNTLVVIKLLLFGPDFTWEDLKFFEREAETLQSLDHLAVPKYLNSFEIDTELGKGFALVQSYIEAQSLQNWVESGRSFSEEELKAIAEDLLGILDYLHNRQPPVVHRDIKPSNILLGDRTGNSPGRVYLVDFGSVQTVAHGGTVTVVGTYGYMPPEQFGGRSLPASDLYGLGATLIYLATGQHPADLPQKDLQVDFEPFTNLNQSFIRWIQWLSEPSVSKRPASAKESLHQFQQAPQRNLTSNRRFSLDIQRPESKIQLKATPTKLEIKVPQSKFKINTLTSTDIFLGCLIGIPISFVLLLICSMLITSGLWWVLFVFVGVLILLGNSSSSNYEYTTTLKIVDNLIYISLVSNNPAYQKLQFFDQKKLQAISAGLSETPKYQLNFKLANSSSTFQIIGDRLEIQWLCDELNEWSGLEIQYEPPASG